MGNHSTRNCICKGHKYSNKTVCTSEGKHHCICKTCIMSPSHYDTKTRGVGYCQADTHPCICKLEVGYFGKIYASRCKHNGSHPCVCKKLYMSRGDINDCKADEHVCLCTIYNENNEPKEDPQICRFNGQHPCICSIRERVSFGHVKCQSDEHTCLCDRNTEKCLACVKYCGRTVKSATKT